MGGVSTEGLFAPTGPAKQPFDSEITFGLWLILRKSQSNRAKKEDNRDTSDPT